MADRLAQLEARYEAAGGFCAGAARFVAATVGGFVENAKVEALTRRQDTTILAGRSAANRLAIAIGRTHDVGAYYIGDRSAEIAPRTRYGTGDVPRSLS